MYSQVNLVGFLGKNCESKIVNEKLTARFSMSVKCGGKEQPAWVTVQGWEKTAEIMRDLQTGNLVVVWGQFDHFQTKDNHQVLYVTANRVMKVPKDAASADGETKPTEGGGWG